MVTLYNLMLMMGIGVLIQEVSGYDVSGGNNVVRVRSLMRSVSVRLEIEQILS